MAVSDSLIGVLFDGRYQIERKLGAGGMADVYLAEDQELGRGVAIKILNGRHANDDQFIERFRREAKNAAALNHPNIVSIYDRGEAEDTYYIAMEYLDGRTLKELIVKRGQAPVKVAVEYGRQILAALRFAHRHGIVHRDIKPHNVLVDGEGRVKVTDFGIARAGTSQMTETGSIVGTAQYLSPEQAKGGEVDQRSDLYSLGVVLYELLTGKTPFEGDTPVEIAMKHLSTTPTPPSQLRPDIPPELDMVVLRALAKNPDDRYQSTDEMEADLERVARGAPVAAATVDSATRVMPAVADDATSMTRIAAAPVVVPPFVEEEEYEEPGARRPWWPWVVAVLFVIGALVAGFFVWQELTGSKPTVPVALYTGLTEAHAKQQITGVNLNPAVQRGTSDKYAKGLVFKQDPSPGVHVEKGGTVTIWVSTGPPKFPVPDVKNQTWPQAQKALTDAGFKPVERSVPGPTKGQVTATDPPAGTEIPKGTTVTVNVMSGPVTNTVPNVVGMSLSTAQAALHNAGFNVNIANTIPSNQPPNTVVSQSPQPNSTAQKNSTVNLTLSSGPPQVDVPDVVTYTSQYAVQVLENAGFKVSQQYEAVTDVTQDNIVQSQNPDGGSRATQGTTVTITIGQYSPPGATTATTPTTTG